MKAHSLIYAILFTLLLNNGIAQIPSVYFEKYTAQNGLTLTSTGALLQDSHGFLWIGTDWGLNRYDGRLFKHYNNSGKDAMADLAIRSLAEDREGNIWISTPIGLSCMNSFTEKFTNYFEGSQPGNIPHGFCYVYCDKENNIWVGDSYGISLFNRQTNAFTQYPINTAGKDTRVNRYIDDFFEDSKGRFWLSTSYGIKLFDRVKKTYYSYHFQETDGKGIDRNATQGIFEDKDGNIWAGTWNEGLIKFNAQKNIFENFHIAGESSEGLNIVHDVNAITLNNHYYLLLATGAGLALIDPQKPGTGKFTVEKIIEEPTDANTHSSKSMSTILKDRQGIYWISGDPGLIKIDPSKQVFQWKTLPNPSFRNSIIYHVIPDIKEPQQKVFLTTTDGWWKYDITTQSFTQHILPKGFEKLLGNINRFIPTENGYWFTSQAGVGFYDPVANTVKDISYLVKEKIDNKVRTGFICKDNTGRIWFSVYRSGVRVYDPQTGKFTSLWADSTQPDNLYGKTIFDIKQAADGSMLITTAEKMYHVDPVNFSCRITIPACTSETSLERIGPRRILFDKDNRILVLSQQRIYLYQNEKLVQLYPQKEFSGFIMDNFLQDKEGNFWITTNLGLFKTNTSFSEWINMNDKISTEGLDNIEDIFKTANDEFILAGTGRIGIFASHDLSKNSLSPLISFNRLRIGNKEQYLVSPGQQQLDVSFKDPIEIELSAINFSNEKGNRIFYQLKGRDNDWKELTGNPVIRYEQLPPDNYILKVKAANGDGVWSRETSLAFTIIPPFWKTWWFIGMIMVFIASGIYIFYRYRLRQLIQIEKLRTRIATDLHDDIGATLSSISFYSEAAKQKATERNPEVENILGKMGETSRAMVSSMSDIVWAINPRNDDMGKMITRMQSYAAELCAVKNIILQVHADENVHQLKPRLEQRKNIYLIFKEALNNALKYSGCQHIILSIQYSRNQFTMQLKDDGKGFDTGREFTGNGLMNMQRRAAEINGALRVISKINEGTQVKLVVKIT